jgi:hypothetical protein
MYEKNELQRKGGKTAAHPVYGRFSSVRSRCGFRCANLRPSIDGRPRQTDGEQPYFRGCHNCTRSPVTTDKTYLVTNPGARRQKQAGWAYLLEEVLDDLGDATARGEWFSGVKQRRALKRARLEKKAQVEKKDAES